MKLLKNILETYIKGILNALSLIWWKAITVKNEKNISGTNMVWNMNSFYNTVRTELAERIEYWDSRFNSTRFGRYWAVYKEKRDSVNIFIVDVLFWSQIRFIEAIFDWFRRKKESLVNRMESSESENISTWARLFRSIEADLGYSAKFWFEKNGVWQMTECIDYWLAPEVMYHKFRAWNNIFNLCISMELGVLMTVWIAQRIDYNTGLMDLYKIFKADSTAMIAGYVGILFWFLGYWICIRRLKFYTGFLAWTIFTGTYFSTATTVDVTALWNTLGWYFWGEISPSFCYEWFGSYDILSTDEKGVFYFIFFVYYLGLAVKLGFYFFFIACFINYFARQFYIRGRQDKNGLWVWEVLALNKYFNPLTNELLPFNERWEIFYKDLYKLTWPYLSYMPGALWLAYTGTFAFMWLPFSVIDLSSALWFWDGYSIMMETLLAPYAFNLCVAAFFALPLVFYAWNKFPRLRELAFTAVKGDQVSRSAMPTPTERAVMVNCLLAFLLLPMVYTYVKAASDYSLTVGGVVAQYDNFFVNLLVVFAFFSLIAVFVNILSTSPNAWYYYWHAALFFSMCLTGLFGLCLASYRTSILLYGPQSVLGGELELNLSAVCGKFFNLGQFGNDLLYFSYDYTSLILCLITTFVFSYVIFNCMFLNRHDSQALCAILVFLEILCVLAFTSFNVLTFFMLFEATVFPTAYLIYNWGSSTKSTFASWQFILYSIFGSAFSLVACVYIYSTIYSCNFYFILDNMSGFTQKEQFFIWAAFFLAFAVKVPLFPFHSWLLNAHVEASSEGSIVLAAVLLKLGGYGIYRFLLCMMPWTSAECSKFVIFLAVYGVFYSSICAITENDCKRIIAYTSISHMGLAVLGLFIGDVKAFWGGLILLFSHSLTAFALFFIIGIVYEKVGSRDLRDMGGLVQVAPVLSVFLFLFCIINSGFPISVGFLGELYIFLGVFPKVGYMTAFILIVSSVMLLYANLRMCVTVIYGSADPEKIAPETTDVSHAELFTLLMFLCVGLFILINNNHYFWPLATELLIKYPFIKGI